MTTLAWGAILTPEERVKILRIAQRLGIDPSWLTAVIWFESRFDPSAVNPESGATGLIQFMPKEGRSADALGTSTTKLALMSRLEQLDYVDRYFDLPWVRAVGRMKTLSDVYAAVFAPKHVGQPDDFVLYEAPSEAYRLNKALDVNNDGKITKGEAASFVVRALKDGLKKSTEERDPQLDAESIPAPTDRRPHMGALAALQLFAPILAGLIPQLAGILKPESDVAKRNVALAETIVNTITTTTATPNLQAAVEKMQADPAAKTEVQKALVTEPTIMSALQIVEVGGGASGAREADAKIQAAQPDKPFWQTSAVFWVSVMLLPMVYWYVGSSVVGGVDIPADAPWYIQFLKVFGTAWSLDARSGLANLVLGLVLGGICGVYFGISVTQQKQQGVTTPSKEA